MNRWLTFLAGLLLWPAVACASLDSTVDGMLADSQLLSMYSDSDLGRTIIVVGLGMHRKDSVAQEMSRQDAMKTLTAFLKGEKVSSIERASQTWKGDQALEEYYSTITTQVEGSLNSAWMFRTGKHQGMTYTVMVISEKSKDYSTVFNERNNTVEARGVASLSEGVEAARETALNNAIRSAVEQYNGVQMAAKSTIENADKFQAKLSSVSKGHVKRYSVSKEYQRDGNYYVVIVAEVSDKAPEDSQSMAAITENLGRPSFAIDSNDQDVARLIRETLAQNDFEVSSSQSDARYLVKADTSFRTYDAMAGMKGLQTSIRLRISDRFSSDTLVNISSDPDKSTEISDSEALRKQNSLRYAMEDLQPKLVKTIRQQFVDQFNNGSKVLVTLKRFDHMRDVDELKACLESLPLTRSVSVRPVQNRSAMFEVIYLGDPSSLQLAVLKQSRSYRLRGLKAQNAASGNIQLTF